MSYKRYYREIYDRKVSKKSPHFEFRLYHKVDHRNRYQRSYTHHNFRYFRDSRNRHNHRDSRDRHNRAVSYENYDPLDDLSDLFVDDGVEKSIPSELTLGTIEETIPMINGYKMGIFSIDFEREEDSIMYLNRKHSRKYPGSPSDFINKFVLSNFKSIEEIIKKLHMIFRGYFIMNNLSIKFYYVRFVENDQTRDYIFGVYYNPNNLKFQFPIRALRKIWDDGCVIRIQNEIAIKIEYWGNDLELVYKSVENQLKLMYEAIGVKTKKVGVPSLSYHTLGNMRGYFIVPMRRFSTIFEEILRNGNGETKIIGYLRTRTGLILISKDGDSQTKLLEYPSLNDLQRGDIEIIRNLNRYKGEGIRINFITGNGPVGCFGYLSGDNGHNIVTLGYMSKSMFKSRSPIYLEINGDEGNFSPIPIDSRQKEFLNMMSDGDKKQIPYDQRCRVHQNLKLDQIILPPKIYGTYEKISLTVDLAINWILRETINRDLILPIIGSVNENAIISVPNYGLVKIIPRKSGEFTYLVSEMEDDKLVFISLLLFFSNSVDQEYYYYLPNPSNKKTDDSILKRMSESISKDMTKFVSGVDRKKFMDGVCDFIEKYSYTKFGYETYQKIMEFLKNSEDRDISNLVGLEFVKFK